MIASIRERKSLFGLFQLDLTGTVLYARVEKEEGKSGPAGDLTGRNFFEEVEPFTTGDEMRTKIACFTRGTSIADSFRSAFRLESGYCPVKVLLARILEQTNDKRTKSVMVQIQRVTELHL
jgi:hypothetical protein